MAGNQYNLVMADGKPVLVSNTSARILKELAKAGDRGLTYSELRSRTKFPLNSLYVFAARLRKARLISGYMHDRETTLALRDLSARPKIIRRVG